MLDFKSLNLYEAPKIELHVHLEGSLSTEFWDKHNPSVGLKIKNFKSSQNKSLSLFLSCFREIHKALFSPSLYYLATIDFLKQLIKENIKYVEFTWAPGGFWKYHHGNYSEVYFAIKEAMELFKSSIESKILVDFVRSHPVNFAQEIADWLIKERPSEIVGINFGGDEANYPIDPFVPIFETIKKSNFHLTIHSGEVTSEDIFLDSVNKAKPSRIGHGTAIQHPETVKILTDLGIHIEACPSSTLCS